MRVESSTNLMNWITLWSFPGAATPGIFRHTNAPHAGLFYRAVIEYRSSANRTALLKLHAWNDAAVARRHMPGSPN
jgi:hypothetical protein